LKACSKCKEVKPSDAFSPDKRATTRLQSQCRDCISACRNARRAADPDAARKRERDHYRENSERVLARNAEWREKHPELVKARKRDYYNRVKNTPEYQEKSLTYRRMTKERRRQYDKEYSKNNRDKKAATALAWAKANPEKRRDIVFAYDAKRRTNKRAGDSPGEVLQWRKAQKKVCYWCSCKCGDNYHVDHYTPLSKGGTHTVDNLVIACPRCNLTKSAKDPYEFAQSVGRLF